MIKKTQQDLLPNYVLTATEKRIPEDLPRHHLERYRTANIEDVGEPMTACFMTQSMVDPKTWYDFLPMEKETVLGGGRGELISTLNFPHAFK